MNVSKKIKSFQHSSSILFISGALFLFNSTSIFAQSPTVTGAENLTPGYTTLLLDYPTVQKQMRTAIAQGKGAQWRTWMDAGLRKNESMYWWLLSDWLWATGNKGDAYKASVQAYVLMKVEMPGCGYSSNQITEVTNSMLKQRSYILAQKPSQDTIKTAVLESITRVQNHLNRGQPLPEMSCHFVETQKAQKGSTRQQTVKLSNPSKEKRAFQRKMMQQESSLRHVKNEMSYSTMFSHSDANVLWDVQHTK